MDFQHDPVGLADVVRRLLRPAGVSSAEPAVLRRGARASGGRFWGRALVDARCWQGLRRRRRRAQTAARLRQALAGSGKPVLVYVVPYDIGKLQSGGGRRIAGLARSLSADFNVFVVSTVWTEVADFLVRLAPDCQLVALPVEASFWKECVRINAVRGAGIFAFPDHCDLLQEFQAVLELLGAQARAWGYSSPTAWPVVARHRRPDAPVFYDAHDDCACFLQNSYGCSDPRLVGRLVDLEREALAGATVAAFCTESDRAAARARCPEAAERMIVVPNGVDTAACRTVFPGQARANGRAAGWDRPTAVFVGAHHQPNLEALACIVRDLAPAFPQVVFVAAGIHLAAYLDWGGPPPGANVVFAGPVSEEVKEALFALAGVALAPMKSGTGSSLKIPDYVAHGKIVIGTPVGLRGFEALARSASVIQTPDVGGALGAVLARLEQDPEAFDPDCRAARAEVQAAWDWSVVARPLVAALGGRPAPGTP